MKDYKGASCSAKGVPEERRQHKPCGDLSPQRTIHSMVREEGGEGKANVALISDALR